MLGWLIQNQKLKKIVTIQLILLVAVFLFLPVGNVVYAGTTEVFSEDFGLEPIEDTLILGTQDIRITIAKIIRVVLSFLGIIALVLVLYAGFTIMTSAGNPQKVETGKKILLNAGIGLLIIMSSLAITQFILTKLAEATGYNANPRGGGPPGSPTYTASGSLGAIVKDHYPFRNQVEVARNTRISVTFFMPLDPASVIVDNNANGTFGDCINIGNPLFSWWDDCDRVGLQLTEMNVLAVYEDASVYTLVLRPRNYLGDSVRDVSYSVTLTDNILREGAIESMFETDADGIYEWRFRTGTELDLTPPRVLNVYPRDTQNVPRNTIIQINFNEAIDPTTSQGSIGRPADTFTNIIFDRDVPPMVNPANSIVEGYWKVSSGYKTAEFVSYNSCGQNSCGDEMFCIPTACTTGDEACVDPRRILVRTADLVVPGSFEGQPFSGVMDMAGNALDGDSDLNPDGKPGIGVPEEINVGEELPDNYLWGFGIQNIIDRTAPYIISVLPNPDEQSIPVDAPFEILFSKPMWSATLGNITVQEYPIYRPFWFRGVSELQPDDTTLVRFNHRAFGPDEMDLYYFTSVDTKVKSLSQNCIYPGRGPEYSVIEPTPDCVQDINGIEISGCVDTTYVGNGAFDTACVFNGAGGDLLQANIQDCLDRLDDADVSPVTP